MNAKERFLSVMNGKEVLWIGDPWSCFNCTAAGRPNQPDAISEMIGRPSKGDMDFKNAWGVCYIFPEDQPAAVPHVNAGNAVVKDIERWREQLRFPDIDGLDWSGYKEIYSDLDREKKLTLASIGEGMFEFSRSVMGFEECLMSYLTNPDEMREMLEAFTDWKIRQAGIIIEEMRPDIILSYDDWGSNDRLFLPPDVWREIIKPLYAKLYGFIRSRGVYVMHHCDCYAECLARDMVEIGVDIWQGVTPENDIPKIIKNTDGRLMLLGGVDMQKIDFEEISEEAVRAEIDRAIENYAPYGHFLPCFTSIVPIHPKVNLCGADEMERYGEAFAERVRNQEEL